MPFPLRWPAAALCLPLGLASGCASPRLPPEVAAVDVSTSPPAAAGLDPSRCQSLGGVVGQAGAGFRGWVPGEDVEVTALNDLRRRAASLGANFVQHDPPVRGVAGNVGTDTIPTTVKGTAYRCERMK
jgi:hypothetical protein